jgi:hypothetical protein
MLLLKIVALLAFALFLAPALVLASVGTKHRSPLQVGLTHQWSDLSSLSVEDINRRTLKAAAAIRQAQGSGSSPIVSLAKIEPLVLVSDQVQ